MVYPWAQGTPALLNSPPFPVFKLCAFDHLLALKILYAKSSQAPEVKDRGADTLASGILSSPCSAPLQFRLGEQKQEWQLFPLPGHMPPLDCLRAPLPARGEMDPFSAQCLLAGAPDPRGLYIHVHPTPSMLHACYTLQPKCSPSSCILPAVSLR